MARDDFDSFAVVAAGRLYRTAYLMVGDHHLSEDLAQDVLARVYVAWPRISGDPHGYAYRALGRAVSNHRRWRKRHPEAPEEQLPSGPTVGAFTDRIAERAEIVAALRDLPHRQRLVVVLRYFADLTEVQTADAMNVSVGTVKTQHSRALSRLRVLLGTDVLPLPEDLGPPPTTPAWPVVAVSDRRTTS